MNKKIFAGVAALILSMSGVLCGCDANKNTDSDKNSSPSSSKSDSVSADNEKEESSVGDFSLTDKIYKDYLSQQKLCTISKNFKILEAGTARDNPNGLAGAVKFDFDGDKTDELVTFTFEKNSTNGEDIRVDLLKVSGDTLTVADSKYLTEMLEINDIEYGVVSNTIFFSKDISMEIVTSEYNDALYFGTLLSYDGYVESPGATEPYLKSLNIFTVDDDHIVPCTIAGTYMKYSTIQRSEYEGVLYATLLPPSIRDTSEFSECKVAEDRLPEFNYDYAYKKSAEIADEINSFNRDKSTYTLFADVNSPFVTDYYVEGGLYDSGASAYTALLNEFGLDIEFNNIIEYDDFECTARFVPKNQSTLKTILEIDAVRGYTEGNVLSSDDNLFMGSRLTLSSDLETILNNDNLFTEPFADELALYEDILRYPYYYLEIWDTYAQLSNGSPLIGFSYCIADVNRDDKYEMVITSYADSNQLPLHCSVIMPDLTTIDIDGQGETKFFDNGVVSVTEVGGAMSPVHYYDINTNTSWTANDVRQEDMEYIRAIWQDYGDTRLEGTEAEKKEQELSNGNILLLNEVYYSLYSNVFSELIVVEDISEITYTWQKAYLSAIDEFKEIGNAPYGTEYEYALLYIDADDIPELYIIDKITGISGLYTYHNGDAVLVSQAGSARANAFYGYIKNKGIFVTTNSGGMYYWGHEITQLSNGCASITETFTCEDEVYYINDTKVTEKDFEDKLARYSDQFAEITYCSESKIKRTLNGIAETWQNAYIEKIDEISGLSSEYTEAALLYIDDDDIPEIYIQNYSYRNAAYIYSYRNGEAYEMGEIGGLRMSIGGYKKKGSMYYSDFNSGAGEVEGHDFYQLENGYCVFKTSFIHYLIENEYHIDNEKVDEKTYNQRFAELTQDMNSTLEILSYDEIMEKLNTSS